MNTNTLTKEKIASILEPHTQHLADMKARGKSLSEMLYWVRTTKGYVLNPAQLESFLKQKESAAVTHAEADTKVEPAADAELEYQQLMNPAPAPVSSRAVPDNQPTTLNNKLFTAPGTLAGLMDKFKQVLSRVMDNSDDQPDTLKVIDKMMHTVISFEQGKERLELSKRTLKIKEADHQRKVSQANNKINIIDPVGDDVRSLIIPQKTHDNPPPPMPAPQRASEWRRSSVSPADQTETSPPPPHQPADGQCRLVRLSAECEGGKSDGGSSAFASVGRRCRSSASVES